MTAHRSPAHGYRCGYCWFPRRRRVRTCPRCKSRLWDTPRLRIPTYGGGLGIDEVIGGRRSAVLRIAERYGGREVRVFGSVARRQATPASDVDLLVSPVTRRYDPISLARALARLLGREVDVVSAQSLHRFAQPQVIAEAIPL